MRVFIGAVMPNRRPIAYIEYPAIVNPLAIGRAFLASGSNCVLVLVERRVYRAKSSRHRVGLRLWTLGSSNSSGTFNAEGNFFICCCMEMGVPVVCGIPMVLCCASCCWCCCIATAWEGV